MYIYIYIYILSGPRKRCESFQIASIRRTPAQRKRNGNVTETLTVDGNVTETFTHIRTNVTPCYMRAARATSEQHKRSMSHWSSSKSQ